MRPGAQSEMRLNLTARSSHLGCMRLFSQAPLKTVITDSYHQAQ